MSLQTVYDRVKKLMSDFELFLEDENHLILGYYHQYHDLDPNTTTLITLFKQIKNGTVPSIGTITRAARKVREENVALRASNYIDKIGMIQEEFKKEIKAIKA